MGQIWNVDRGGGLGLARSCNLYSVQTFGPLNDVKINGLTCFQGLVAVHLYRRVMGEQILALAVFNNESVAFCVVEPLNLAALDRKSVV